MRKHYKKGNRNQAGVDRIASHLGRTPNAIRGMVSSMKLSKKHNRAWTQRELEFLADNYGRMPAEVVARRLKRSKNALKIIAYRKLGIDQRSNIYTASNVANIMGIACPKTIVRWQEVGYIKGKRAPFSYGNHTVWFFDYEDIIECLRKRPWLVDLKKMETCYFRSIVQEAYDKNPWYTCAEAAPLLGVKDKNAVHRYIYRGWLPAVKKPGGPHQGVWIIRLKDIRHFQLYDPRPEHRRAMTLPTHIKTQMDKAATKAWTALHRGRFESFGYWASQWATLNRIGRFKMPDPFAELIDIANEHKSEGKEVDN